jgi:putative membrane protein
VSILSVFLKQYEYITIYIPITVTAMLSAALSIYLGFRSNNAYERWWEARIIWGALINDSRSWARQVFTHIVDEDDNNTETDAIKKELIYRHIAFVNALRVFLRGGPSIAHEQTREIYKVSNDLDDIKKFLSAEEFEEVSQALNPPNMILQKQGKRLAELYKKKFLTDYRFVNLESSLVEFSNIQGRSERIKNTAFPRPYSYFQRVFVWVHGILVPFAYVALVDWMIIPIAFILNYVFLTIDFVGSRIEDPFENRIDDVPLSSITRTIEINLREALGEKSLPEKQQPIDGVMF